MVLRNSLLSCIYISSYRTDSKKQAGPLLRRALVLPARAFVPRRDARFTQEPGGVCSERETVDRDG
eukprot:scaffold83283_cov32-Tisochrysis_lutea.AAC.3